MKEREGLGRDEDPTPHVGATEGSTLRRKQKVHVTLRKIYRIHLQIKYLEKRRGYFSYSERGRSTTTPQWHYPR